MSGSTNLQQWNPSGANQDSDSAYTSDSQRTGGASNPSIFDSATANKLFYQLSTFCVAFGQALAAKGYTISDASLSALAGVLASVTTEVDLAAALALYAPLASPVLTGTPSAPTPAASDDSTHIATTAYVAAALAASLYPAAFTSLAASSGLAVTGPTNFSQAPASYGPPAGFNAEDSALPANPLTFSPTTGTWLASYGTRLANTAWVNEYFAALSSFSNSFAPAGYQKLPGGLIIQWGVGTVSGQSTISQTFALAFPSYCLAVVGVFGSAIALSSEVGTLGFDANNASSPVGTFTVTNSANSATGGIGFRYIAVGH